MQETLFEELKRYVAFGPADEEALRGFHPVARPHFERISETFYARILEHEQARKALTEGESMVGRLRHTLVEWMDKLLTGPWDEEYYQLRARIGRKHVDIKLAQHYMFGAMNVLRQELNALIDSSYIGQPQLLIATRLALGKILDLELAVMLHTYREDLLSQQARSERLSTFGQLVGSIGHELRNPLGVMESSLYILRGRMAADDARVKKHIDRIGEQLGIANSIISDLLDMIRDKPLMAETVKLRDVVEAAANLLHMTPELAPLAGLPEVRGDPSQLRQVFVNLLQNAQQAAGPGGAVTIDTEATETQVAVGVADTGPGVDASVRARLFEPLVTTRQKGIGLGLALVKRIVERHGGTVAYEPRGPGARFVVRLPRIKQDESPATGGARSAERS
ncbi:MAG TPA: protoglobin domain-containing protein [Myxococcales bacterium]|nr:protoglobin domain-containing protein [Myxococcales bacterium]